MRLVSETQQVHVTVPRESGTKSTEVTAFVLPKITATITPVDWTALQDELPHLKGVPFSKPPDSTVDMLIGIDAPDLHSVVDERPGKQGEPIARRTPLGWICFGPTIETSTRQQKIHTTTMLGIPPEQPELEQMVRSLFELEMTPTPAMNQEPMSVEDQCVEKATEGSLKFNNGRVEVSIPWKNGDEPTATSNRANAEHRLKSLLISLSKRSEVAKEYQRTIDSYLQKGYIRPVSDAEIKDDDDHQWFLPHFPVVKNDRTTTKVRIVFDAAAKKDGRSINDDMHSGPPLLNNLVGCILKFCKEPVAMVGDIGEMFLQVLLAEKDRKYHRFLWSVDGCIQVYEFQRLCFGMKASPYLACKAVREVAKRNIPEDSLARQIIMDNIYMDDLLCSVESPEACTTLRREVQSALDHGGFHLRKWLSNNREVMETIPEEDRAPAATLVLSGPSDQIPTVTGVKTLGVTWSATEDTFSFEYCVPDISKYTKRSVLSKIAMVFDPRGQVSPYTIRAKVLFQDACLRGQSWDEEFDSEQQQQWQRFFNELPDLARIRAPRCFKEPARYGDEVTTTVHTFTDASDCAYAAATYIRTQYPDNVVRVTLAMAKAKPAPLRKRSIPMLELRGAVLGTKVAMQVCTALDLSPQQCQYWTDSMNVLAWVKNHSRRFKVEVGNRIAESVSESDQWQHVRSKTNPADKATRGMSGSSFI